MANNTLAFIRKIMNWHAARSDDFRSPLVRGMERAKSQARERLLSDDEIRPSGEQRPLLFILRFPRGRECRQCSPLTSASFC